MAKPKFFLSVDTYLPGYRGGGPTQSIKNLVQALSNKFEFYIFTANHDLGLNKPYENIVTDDWNNENGVHIFYTSDINREKNIIRVLKEHNYTLFFFE